MLNEKEFMPELSFLYEKLEFINTKRLLMLMLLYSNNLVEIYNEIVTLLG